MADDDDADDDYQYDHHHYDCHVYHHHHEDDFDRKVRGCQMSMADDGAAAAVLRRIPWGSLV